MSRIVLEPIPTGDGRVVLGARGETWRDRVRRILARWGYASD